MATRRPIRARTQAPRGGWGYSHAAPGARTDRKVAETSAVRVFCREDFHVEIGDTALKRAGIRLQSQLRAGILLPAVAHGVGRSEIVIRVVVRCLDVGSVQPACSPIRQLLRVALRIFIV